MLLVVNTVFHCAEFSGPSKIFPLFHIPLTEKSLHNTKNTVEGEKFC